MIDNYFVQDTVVQAGYPIEMRYAGPREALIFDEIGEDALKTQALKIDITFYCRKCYGMATGKTCPHSREDQIQISGTEQREMLSNDADIPLEFSRPEVVSILKKYYASLKS